MRSPTATFVLLGEDERITAGACRSNAFGAYHSVSDVGHGPIYAVSTDPIIETQRSRPGRTGRDTPTQKR